LNEVSFRRLIQATQANGRYRVGAMRQIGTRWVCDATIPGRIENSRFVITRPPSLIKNRDGSVTIRYNFKSRPGASTSGLRCTGYVKLLPAGDRVRYQFGQNVKVWCSCPDFKFRWHKVLSDMGASHTPTGSGGEATNADPLHTNPSHVPSLCKHLCAMGAYISGNAKDLALQRGPARPARPAPSTPPKPAKPAPEPVDQRDEPAAADPERSGETTSDGVSEPEPEPRKPSRGGGSGISWA
jgi:hypothetical protein